MNAPNASSNLRDLVFVGALPPELQRVLDAEFRCHQAEAVLADPALARGIEGIITRSNVSLPEAVVASLPSLKIIATCGVGYDGIPLAAARQRGIIVTNTPGVLDDAVCELGVGILLALLRRIPEGDSFTRSGRWAVETFPLTTSLAGKRVGIVGLGRIGQGIAARLAGFGVKLAYTGSRQAASPHRHIEKLHDLARESDVLFVCCRGGESTRKLINSAVLEALGAEGFLINMSRGSVVDEPALMHALKTGGIKGAGLDVYEDEPRIDPAFFDLPNTVLMPHVGSATTETRAVMLRLTLDNLHAVLGGGAPLTPV
jgi:lactate dehydrogenase-like 2-hydroxyacid dehydrogenase